MINYFIERYLRTFEQSTGVSADYARDIKKGSTSAFVKFLRVMSVAHHRKAVPMEASCVAAIASVIQIDCGPCLQIVVSMGLQQGIDPALIKAAIRGDDDALGPALSLVHRYGADLGQGKPARPEDIERRLLM